MLILLALALACAPDTADTRTIAAAPCDEGFELRADGYCYELADAGTIDDPDTDTAGPVDTGWVDADRDGSLSTIDCDDADATIHPGGAEVCNGIDDDCDGAVDEGVTLTLYADADADGYGDADAPVTGCAAPAGTVDNAEDCEDRDEDAYPGASEVWYNGVDNNCDGLSDYDADGDGYDSADDLTTGTDCDDTDAAVYPGAGCA